MNAINTIESFTPANIEVVGKTKTERQLSVVHQASAYTKMALVNVKGKVGQLARNGLANGGIMAVAKQAAYPSCNYRPAGEYFAAILGEPMFISNRATFESLPDQMEARIAKAKLGKNGGFITDKKTGIEKPGAALARAMELKAAAVEMVEAARQFTEQAKAEQAAAKQALTA